MKQATHLYFLQSSSYRDALIADLDRIDNFKNNLDKDDDQYAEKFNRATIAYTEIWELVQRMNTMLNKMRVVSDNNTLILQRHNI